MIHSSSGPSAAESLISVIIPNLDGLRFLRPCLSSLFAQGSISGQLEVLLIDNGSRDGSVEHVRQEFPAVRVMPNPENVGFTHAVNQGLDAARGEWILLLNNDTVMEPDALRILFEHLQTSDVHLAGVQPLLLWAGDQSVVDSAGIVLGERFGAHDQLHGKLRAHAPQLTTEVWGLCFACALIRRDVFRRAGGLDPDFFAEWDDVDFATRARWLGYRFELVPDVEVLHHRSPTSERDSVAKFTRLRRNRVLTFIKCLPRGMATRLVLYRLQHDLGMLVHFVRKGELSAVCKSWWGVLRLGPRMLKRRREWRRHTQLSDKQMHAQISQAMRDG